MLANCGELIAGLENIARVMRYSPNTIARWVKFHDFPAIKGPRGIFLTDPAAIDVWILRRHWEQVGIHPVWKTHPLARSLLEGARESPSAALHAPR